MLQSDFFRVFQAMRNDSVDIFLGSGASIGSGIPTGQDLIWHFKRGIYCAEHGLSPEQYKDLYLESTRNLFQNYFDGIGTYPVLYSSNEYSYYFEKCYPTRDSRRELIESLMNEVNPSIGYLCLADVILRDKIKSVWTTNFDNLLEIAVNILNPKHNLILCSSANSGSVSNFNPDNPAICKLHGDYRYDSLQNTDEELKKLENELTTYWEEGSKNKSLFVIGYAGNDESIMSVLEKHASDKSFLSKGIMWAIIKGSQPSKRVSDLLDLYNKHNKHSDVVEIDGFDNFFSSLYSFLGYHNEIIENQWDKYCKHNKSLVFERNKVVDFVKYNGYIADSIPECNVFDTDIKTWKELKEITQDTEIIAGLFKNKIYSFSPPELLNSAFGDKVKSGIRSENVPIALIRRNNSFYIGMLYQLIEYDLRKRGYISYRRNKYYNPSTFTINNGNRVFEAFEVSLSYLETKIYLSFIPSVHILKSNGRELDKNNYQFEVNKHVSKVYNNEYNDKLHQIELNLKSGNLIEFSYDKLSLAFNLPAISSGGKNRKPEWTEFESYRYEEPVMLFAGTGDRTSSVHQLRGLTEYGPIDNPLDGKRGVIHSIRLAVVSPEEYIDQILTHLHSLNQVHTPDGYDKYLINYEGFEKVYRKALIIPDKTNKDLCKTYKKSAFGKKSANDFLCFLKRGIDVFASMNTAFDVLVIFIPKEFKRFRESTSVSLDYNLHDAIKLYATEKNVRVQFIEERSVTSPYKCKVMWALSTSLYAKSQGTLWRPKAIVDGTAYVGVSYSQSKEKGICIGCSQLFDSTGTGIRMILKKINSPKFCGKNNPYMNKDEARNMMQSLREQYYHCCPVSKLKRIVIHKTTPFMKDEIIGITQAFEGIADIELIQIQEYNPWRGLRFSESDKLRADSFAIKRGTATKINDESFLLWTHGTIVHPQIAGTNNYYKNGRGIPSPLLVKRFYGDSPADVLAEEILMLSKMNWNSGDSLYKVLPVTLDFAKTLSRMSKQDEAIYDKSYDFRYFM